MSDQNLDANNSLPTGASFGNQFLPIASQIGSQAYISHVQGNDVVDEEREEPVKATAAGNQHAGESNTDDAEAHPTNKMDAFFREAELERQRLLDEQEAMAAGQRENQSLLDEIYIESSAGDLSDDAVSDPTPVVELPVVSDQVQQDDDAEQSPEEKPQSLDQQMFADAAPMEIPAEETPVAETPVAEVVAPVEFAGDAADQQQSEPHVEYATPEESTFHSPFSASGFGNGTSFGQGGSEDAFQQTPPATPEEKPVENVTSDSPSSDPSSPDASSPDPSRAADLAQLFGATAEPDPVSPTQFDSSASGLPASAEAKSTPALSEAAPEPAPSRLTGRLGLSAAVAGLGLGATLAASMSSSADGNSAPQAIDLGKVNPFGQPSRVQPPALEDQQMQKEQARQDDAPDQGLNAQQQFKPQAADKSEEQQAPDSFAAFQLPVEAAAQADNVIEPIAESQPESNLSSANFAYPNPFAQAKSEQSVPVENVSSEDAEVQSPPEVDDENVSLEESGVEDARLAAMQKAQEIKQQYEQEVAEADFGLPRPGDVVATANETESGKLESVVAAVPAQPVTDESAHLAQVLDQMGDDDSVRDAKGRQFPIDMFHQYLFENLRSGVVYVDHQRRVKLWSKGAEAMTGITADAVMERPLYPQTYNLRQEDGTGVTLTNCPVVQCLEQAQPLAFDYRILNAANLEVKIKLTVTPVIDDERYVNGVIIVFDDHSAEIDLQRQLKDLYEFSVLDPLTQVANRAEFERVLEEYVRAFNTSENFNCSLIICDIDYFKSINDKFGHAVGDVALVAFADMLRKYVRSQDLVARYGGEEFVILCADCDTNSALQRAEQIRMALFKTQQPMLEDKAISASFGVSELRSGDTAMEFFVRADTALLKAKEMGRNRVVIADQREVTRDIGNPEDSSASGLQWRKQRRQSTALICSEFKTATPVAVLVEKLRGFIVDKDAWLQRVDQEFLSMEVDIESPEDYSRKGSFTMNIEFKDADDPVGVESRRMTFVRVTIFAGRKKKWFSTNHTDVAPHLLAELRGYLMINDEGARVSVEMATEDVRGKEARGE